jgi:dynactin complex subunit
MPSQVPQILKVGDRIQVDQDVATVRYIGPVDNTDGDWLGVEWDDVSRGKHSGEKDGKSYFTCRYLVASGRREYRKNTVLKSNATDTRDQDHFFVTTLSAFT